MLMATLKEPIKASINSAKLIITIIFWKHNVIMLRDKRNSLFINLPATIGHLMPSKDQAVTWFQLNRSTVRVISAIIYGLWLGDQRTSTWSCGRIVRRLPCKRTNRIELISLLSKVGLRRASSLPVGHRIAICTLPALFFFGQQQPAGRLLLVWFVCSRELLCPPQLGLHRLAQACCSSLCLWLPLPILDTDKIREIVECG